MKDLHNLWRGSLLILIVTSVSCIQSNHQRAKDDNHQMRVDSFSVVSAMKSYTFVGQKIYPIDDCRDAFINATKTGVFLCLDVKDTLYVLLNDRVLCNVDVVSDSLLYYYLSKYYTIEYEDELPYFVYLYNDKDTITLIHNKNEDKYSLESAMITDTIFDIQSTIKVGKTPLEFMDKIGIKNLSSIPDCVFLIPASIIDKAWYNKYLIKDRNNHFLQTSCNDYFSIEIKFDKSRIIYYKIGNWFGEWW